MEQKLSIAHHPKARAYGGDVQSVSCSDQGRRDHISLTRSASSCVIINTSQKEVTGSEALMLVRSVSVRLD